LEGALPENEQVTQGVVLRQVSPGYFRMLGFRWCVDESSKSEIRGARQKSWS